MCIAIVKKKGATISDEALKNSFKNNKDGAGIAYTVNNTIYIQKGIFDVNEFIKAVREAELISDGAMLIHCRISTSGLVDSNNCHPFKVNNGTVMIHNGILDVDVPKDSKINDTQIYINEYLKDLPMDFTKNEAILKLISKDIGSSKFCFLNADGSFAICNEEKGNWVNDVWYSNSTYQEQKTYTWDRSYNWAYSSYGYSCKNVCFMSKNKRKKLKHKIENLSYLDFTRLGDFPMINKSTLELKPSEEIFTDEITEEEMANWYYLDEIDYELQDMYEENYAIALYFDENDYEDEIEAEYVKTA